MLPPQNHNLLPTSLAILQPSGKDIPGIDDLFASLDRFTIYLHSTRRCGSSALHVCKLYQGSSKFYRSARFTRRRFDVILYASSFPVSQCFASSFG